MKQTLKILSMALVFIVGYTLSVSAATFKIGEVDWWIGGALLYDVGYQVTDYGDRITGDDDSRTDFFVENPGCSRIQFKATYGKLTAMVDEGIKGSNDRFGDDKAIYTRQAFMSYDMGGGNSILVGQTYSPTGLHFAEQRMYLDNALFGAGNLYMGRNPMVKFTHSVDNWTLQVALEDNDTVDVTGIAYDVIDQLTPAVHLCLTYGNDSMWITPAVFMQRYEYKGTEDVTVNGWVANVEGGYKLDVCCIDYGAFYGQNVGIFADVFNLRPEAGFGLPIDDGTGDIEDVSSYGGWAQLGFPMDSATLFVGGGYQQAAVEDEDTLAVQYEDSVAIWSAFVSVKYPIYEGFYVQPELSYFDYGDGKVKSNTNDLGTDLFVGVHFQYDF